jgi:phosphate transport system permease protein
MNDRLFSRLLTAIGVAVLVVFSAFLLTLVINSSRSIGKFGIGFLFGKNWNPVTLDFGALPFIVGTLLTSGLALIISVPFSLAVGILLGEYAINSRFTTIGNTVINLLASIPSVVFGLWGMVVIVPVMQKLEMFFHVPPYGVGIVSASLVLAIMIIPYMASLTREVLMVVPSGLKHSALALGATRREMLTGVVLPYARSGIMAGVLMALGRALGETMAVTMLIGNATRIPTSIFSTGNTLASVIASQFTEAENDIHRAAMIELALILLVLNLTLNVAGRKIIERMAAQHG